MSRRTGPLTGPVTVALDATEGARPQRTGIGVYAEKLIAALGTTVPQELNGRFRVVLCFRPGPYLRWGRRMALPPSFLARPLLDPWLPYPAATLFHGLNQRLPQHRYPATVVTLHERFPAAEAKDYSTAEFRQHMRGRIEQAVQRADCIIAVSRYVRDCLVAHDPALGSKTRVIHHGVGPAASVAEEEASNFREQVLGLRAGERFFLNVGAVQVRKNVSNIVLALRTLPGFRLVIAGADGYGAEGIHEMVRREGLDERVTFLGHRQPAELRRLYASATALVFPSLEEAFGMPVLEAMSYGLPVITSNRSALPEVGGDAAVYVDPADVAQISGAMRRVAEDAGLAAELARRGRERAALFTWEECARKTWAVYAEASGRQ